MPPRPPAWLAGNCSPSGWPGACWRCVRVPLVLNAAPPRQRPGRRRPDPARGDPGTLALALPGHALMGIGPCSSRCRSAGSGGRARHARERGDRSRMAPVVAIVPAGLAGVRPRAWRRGPGPARVRLDGRRSGSRAGSPAATLDRGLARGGVGAAGRVPVRRGGGRSAGTRVLVRARALSRFDVPDDAGRAGPARRSPGWRRGASGGGPRRRGCFAGSVLSGSLGVLAARRRDVGGSVRRLPRPVRAAPSRTCSADHAAVLAARMPPV